MRMHDLTHDGQPETRSLHGLVLSIGGPEESVEKMRNLVSRHSHSGVGDVDRDSRTAGRFQSPGRLDANRPSLGRELPGVLAHIGESQLDPALPLLDDGGASWRVRWGELE